MGEPCRTCVGCRARRSQSELIRLYRDQAGALRMGRTGPGRGAWLCRGSLVTCFDAAMSSRSFERSLRGKVHPDQIGALRDELEQLTRCGNAGSADR